MDLANLNAFIAIAEAGSFSEAAERLRRKYRKADVLLVDDVFTTGSTMLSCAGEILRSAPGCRISIAISRVVAATGTRAQGQGKRPLSPSARAAARAAAAAKQDAVCSRVLAGRVVAGSRCRASSTPAPSSQNLNGSM